MPRVFIRVDPRTPSNAAFMLPIFARSRVSALVLRRPCLYNTCSGHYVNHAKDPAANESRNRPDPSPNANRR